MDYILAGNDGEGIHARFEEGRYGNHRDRSGIETRVEEVTEKTERFIRGRTSEELKRVITLPWHADFPMQGENVLVQIVVENLNHFGELMAILWQIGGDPPSSAGSST